MYKGCEYIEVILSDERKILKSQCDSASIKGETSFSILVVFYSM